MVPLRPDTRSSSRHFLLERNRSRARGGKGLHVETGVPGPGGRSTHSNCRAGPSEPAQTENCRGSLAGSASSVLSPYGGGHLLISHPLHLSHALRGLNF